MMDLLLAASHSTAQTLEAKSCTRQKYQCVQNKQLHVVVLVELVVSMRTDMLPIYYHRKLYVFLNTSMCTSVFS